MNAENNPKQVQEDNKPAELTENDLEQVAGGGLTPDLTVNKAKTQLTTS